LSRAGHFQAATTVPTARAWQSDRPGGPGLRPGPSHAVRGWHLAATPQPTRIIPDQAICPALACECLVSAVSLAAARGRPGPRRRAGQPAETRTRTRSQAAELRLTRNTGTGTVTVRRAASSELPVDGHRDWHWPGHGVAHRAGSAAQPPCSGGDPVRVTGTWHTSILVPVTFKLSALRLRLLAAFFKFRDCQWQAGPVRLSESRSESLLVFVVIFEST
jgi:hypothetical protein